MWPYWAYSYAPDPFQPAILPEEVDAKKMGRCPGFDDDAEHYWCWPQPHEYSNCWKCPPKDPDGRGYTAWSNVSAVFAQHWKDIGIPVFEEIWNEPDLVRAADCMAEHACPCVGCQASILNYHCTTGGGAAAFAELWVVTDMALLCLQAHLGSILQLLSDLRQQ